MATFHPVFDFSAAELVVLLAQTRSARVSEAASARDDALSGRQLRALGLDAAAITRWVRARRLFRRHAGVYAVGRAELTRRGEARAALLRCGRHAALSHRTSAWMLGVLGPRSRTEVTTTAHLAPPDPRSGISFRTTARWRPGEVVWIDGLPCTSLARTLADLAAVSPERDFVRAWNTADQRLLLDVGPLSAQVARGRTGAGVLRARLEHRDEEPPTESVLEDAFCRVCARGGLRPPRRQWPLAMADRTGRVDVVYLPERVAIELDSRRWHAIQAAFERDREKDLALREAGWDPHRYTWRQVLHEEDRVAAAVRRALAAAQLRLAAEAGVATEAAAQRATG